MTDLSQSPIGQSIRRREDERFLTGSGQYTDDVVLPLTLPVPVHGCFLPPNKLESATTRTASSTIAPPTRPPQDETNRNTQTKPSCGRWLSKFEMGIAAA
jgi:hypothetical protein